MGSAASTSRSQVASQTSLQKYGKSAHLQSDKQSDSSAEPQTAGDNHDDNSMTRRDMNFDETKGGVPPENNPIASRTEHSSNRKVNDPGDSTSSSSNSNSNSNSNSHVRQSDSQLLVTVENCSRDLHTSNSLAHSTKPSRPEGCTEKPFQKNLPHLPSNNWKQNRTKSCVQIISAPIPRKISLESKPQHPLDGEISMSRGRFSVVLDKDTLRRVQTAKNLLKEAPDVAPNIDEIVASSNQVFEELDSHARYEVLKFTAEIEKCMHMASILEVVGHYFANLFENSTVNIYLNPGYASKYQRFLRKYYKDMNNSEKLGKARTKVSSLSIGFAQRLRELCGLPDLETIETRSSLIYMGSSSEEAPGKSPQLEDRTSYSFGHAHGSPCSLDPQLSSSDVDDDAHALGCPIFPSLTSCKQSLDICELSFSSEDIIAVCEIRRKRGFEAEEYDEELPHLLAALCIPIGHALERVCIEGDMAKQLEWSKIALRISENLNSKLDTVQLMNEAIRMLRDALFAERGSMYVVDSSASPPDLWTMVSGGEGLRGQDTLRELRIPFGTGIAGYTAEHKLPIIIPDAYKDSRFNPEVDRQTGLRTRSTLCFPIISQNDELVAVVQMINKKDTHGGYTGTFDEDDIALLEKISSHVEVALLNARVTAQNKYNEAVANELLNKMFPKHITEKLKFQNEKRELMHCNSIRGERGPQRIGPCSPLGKSAAGDIASIGPHEPIVEKYEKVFIFFSDIVSFTTLSSTWEPFQVVDMLNELFTHFDELSEKHGVYKLETIGDAYVAVTNLPFMNQRSARHAAENLARFALDTQRFVKSFVTKHGEKIQIRVGINCGPCFGAVVGKRMPRFTIISDAINTAARMESSGMGTFKTWAFKDQKLLAKRSQNDFSVSTKSSYLFPHNAVDMGDFYLMLDFKLTKGLTCNVT